MSKIGKMPITISEGVTVVKNGQVVTVTGPKATLSFAMPEGMTVEEKEKMLYVSPVSLGENIGALHGLTRAMLANLVKGVSVGFEKKLELTGVGYRAQVQGRDLVLSVGFSHPVNIPAPEGITFTVAENVITVAGADKVIVGDVSARIRAIRPPEPYKGKGISYKGERIRRKAGKAAKAVGTK